MYGTCETLCQLLREQYPAETPLNLIVWSPADIEALADGMEYAVSEQDTRVVLARMDAIPEEQRLESGVSAGAVMDLIEQVKQAAAAVSVPADLLETLLTTAEQALCTGNGPPVTAIIRSRKALPAAWLMRRKFAPY